MAQITQNKISFNNNFPVKRKIKLFIDFALQASPLEMDYKFCRLKPLLNLCRLLFDVWQTPPTRNQFNFLLFTLVDKAIRSRGDEMEDGLTVFWICCKTPNKRKKRYSLIDQTLIGQSVTKDRFALDDHNKPGSSISRKRQAWSCSRRWNGVSLI